MRDHRSLKAFQLADTLTVEIYQATRQFPSDERFGLVSQIRRAAVSVPSNIVEGFGRPTDQDTLRFLHTAFASLREVEYQWSLAYRLKFTEEAVFSQINTMITETIKTLRGYIRSFGARLEIEKG